MGKTHARTSFVLYFEARAVGRSDLDVLDSVARPVLHVHTHTHTTHTRTHIQTHTVNTHAYTYHTQQRTHTHTCKHIRTHAYTYHTQQRTRTHTYTTKAKYTQTDSELRHKY